MAYTIIDLLDKLIALEQAACKMYKDIAALDNKKTPAFKTIINVFIKEEKRHIAYYQNLKNEASNFEDIVIDFDIYDKAYSLVNEFRNRIAIPSGVETVKELLRFALDFEKRNVALLLDIQGRLVKSKEDREKASYKILSDLISEEEKHVKNLELFVKN